MRARRLGRKKRREARGRADLDAVASTPLAATVGAAAGWSRAEVVALGRTGNAWAFVPLALGLAAPGVEDDEVRLLLAAAYGRLGLRTAALEQFGSLGSGVAAQAAGLEEMLRRLPPDEASLEERESVLRGNLDALAERGEGSLDLRGLIPSWRESAAETRCFRAAGGNMLRRRRGAWVRFADDAGAAEAAIPSPSGAGDAERVTPYFFEGIDPPWLFRRAALCTPPNPDGSECRLTVVCPSGDDLVEALSLADLREWIAQPRTEWFVGEGASERFAAALRGRFDERIGNRVAVSPLPGERVGAGAIVGGALEEQAGLQRSLAAIMAEVYSGRDRAWWARRYREAFGGGAPLRVLIPSSRFTRFVRFSAEDLADALRGLGCEARVLIEPSAASQFCSVAHLRAYAEWLPDLVIMVNHTRSMHAAKTPRGVPFVTWIQDRVAGLFDEAVGRGLGEVDFVAGHLFPELFDRFGYPRARRLPAAVMVSARKFHDGEATEEQRRRFECEIAFISNHGETAEAMRGRLMHSAPAAQRPALARIVPEIEAGLERLLEVGLLHHAEPAEAGPTGPGGGGPISASIDDLCAGACAPHVRKGEEAAATAAIGASFAYPMFERMLRHQMAEWAAALCEARGWRLHLYGRGWEAHPRLAAHARGVIEHGDDLRAAYKCAGVSLHAGMGGWTHQRVMEAALSGGCTIARLKAEDVWALEWWAQNSIAAEPGLETTDEPGFPHYGFRYAPVADHWQSMMVAGLCQRLGVTPLHYAYGWQALSPAQIAAPWADNAGRPVPMRAAWLLGDPSEAGYWSRESFDRAAAGVVESRERRASLSRWQREAALECFTYDRFARDLLAMVREGVEGAAPRS